MKLGFRSNGEIIAERFLYKLSGITQLKLGQLTWPGQGSLQVAHQGSESTNMPQEIVPHISTAIARAAIS
jgi:hypothetical protein